MASHPRYARRVVGPAWGWFTCPRAAVPGTTHHVPVRPALGVGYAAGRARACRTRRLRVQAPPKSYLERSSQPPRRAASPGRKARAARDQPLVPAGKGAAHAAVAAHLRRRRGEKHRRATRWSRRLAARLWAARRRFDAPRRRRRAGAAAMARWLGLQALPWRTRAQPAAQPPADDPRAQSTTGTWPAGPCGHVGADHCTRAPSSRVPPRACRLADARRAQQRAAALRVRTHADVTMYTPHAPRRARHGGASWRPCSWARCCALCCGYAAHRATQQCSRRSQRLRTPATAPGAQSSGAFCD